MNQIILILSNDIGISKSFTGEAEGPITFYKVIIPILVLGLVVFPLSLMRDISRARYIALASLVSLSITLAVVTIELPFYVKDYHPILSEEERQVVHACPSFNFFNGVGIVFFAFTNHT